MNKTFDCVQYQRDIRNKYIEEANGDLNQLIKLLKSKAKKSDLYSYFNDIKKK
ncbi:MAG: hypothetical protein NTW25_16745 [Candidatus Kapabacteria bacterium]|nr:hypothetical protein [Candidatus Kapabacteria bacterium]